MSQALGVRVVFMMGSRVTRPAGREVMFWLCEGPRSGLARSWLLLWKVSCVVSMLEEVVSMKWGWMMRLSGRKVVLGWRVDPSSRCASSWLSLLRGAATGSHSHCFRRSSIGVFAFWKAGLWGCPCWRGG